MEITRTDVNGIWMRPLYKTLLDNSSPSTRQLIKAWLGSPCSLHFIVVKMWGSKLIIPLKPVERQNAPEHAKQGEGQVGRLDRQGRLG